MDEIQFSPFVVDEKPYCAWGWDLRDRSRNFLRNLDPVYFKFLATLFNWSLNEEDGRQYASVALRTAYHHSLETLFALIFAAMQAPHCVVGWLLRYKNADVFRLVRKVNRGGKITSLFELSPSSWTLISKTINQVNASDSERSARLVDRYGRLWARLAADFVTNEHTAEYNSIKHGFRVRLGGFSVSVGEETVPGNPAAPEAMQSLGGSEFGTSFLSPMDLHNGGTHFWLRQQMINWLPGNLISGISLVGMSVNNVISFLRAFNDVDAKRAFVAPQDEAFFDSPWSQTPGVLRMNLDVSVQEGDTANWTSADILERYFALRDRLKARSRNDCTLG